MLELAGVRYRYNVPLTRTVHIGKASERSGISRISLLKELMWDLNSPAPGNTCEEVEAGWQNVLRQNGLVKESRVGYSIGVGYPPDWGERTCSLRSGDRTELKEGMCFHFQSGVWLDEFGCAVSRAFCCHRQWWRETMRR